jgi:hypothetical protein
MALNRASKVQCQCWLKIYQAAESYLQSLRGFDRGQFIGFVAAGEYSRHGRRALIVVLQLLARRIFRFTLS